ncbi:ankyrin repeat-containing domain protein [Terfezia claveryi]|nr:ankyrin repeat-containing domain protein [Terfezia claveryi]
MCARVFDNHETCKLLVDKGAAIDTPDSSGRTPLSYAAAAGNQWGNFKMLVDKGAELDRSDSSDRTPLSYAAATPFGRTTVKIAKFLVDHGAEVDKHDSSGRTPLSYAVTARGLAALGISKMLVGAGAAVDTPDLCGRTPLSYAAATGPYVFREIIRANVGREVSSRLKGRAPPLTSHIFNDTRIALCTLLLDKGAKIDTTDSAGHSPYWYAHDANNNEICQFLAKRGAKQDI